MTSVVNSPLFCNRANVQHCKPLDLEYLQQRNEVVHKINTVVRLILSLPNYRNVSRPAQLLQVLTLQDGSGFLPIHIAIGSRNEALFSLLVEIFLVLPNPHFYLNSQDRNGNTPLHWCIKSVNYLAAVILMKHGSDVSAMNHEGRTPLHLAVANVDARAERKQDHYTMVEMLLHLKSPINATDNDNITALHIAAVFGDCELVRRLLNKGADPDIQDLQGETALFYALRSKHKLVVQALLHFNASASIPNDEGESPETFCGLNNLTDMLCES